MMLVHKLKSDIKNTERTKKNLKCQFSSLNLKTIMMAYPIPISKASSGWPGYDNFVGSLI